MDLAELVDRVVPFDFNIDGFPIKGNYFKYRITPNYLRALEKMADEGIDDESRGYKILADSIKDWDLTKGGEPFPPTEENLKEVPISYLVVLGKKLGEIRDGNPTENSPSI